MRRAAIPSASEQATRARERPYTAAWAAAHCLPHAAQRPCRACWQGVVQMSSTEDYRRYARECMELRGERTVTSA